MPNKKNLRKWVKALRSGKYKQGVGALRRGGRYCCLGVACEISKLGEWRTAGDQEARYLGSGMALPAEVVEWLGLDNEDPTFKVKRKSIFDDRIMVVEEVAASTLNDDFHYSFEKIANLVEKAYDLAPAKRAKKAAPKAAKSGKQASK